MGCPKLGDGEFGTEFETSIQRFQEGTRAEGWQQMSVARLN